MQNPRLNVVTLGVIDFARSVAFYQNLGFARRFKATGDEIAFFDGGGWCCRCFAGTCSAEDAQVAAEPRPQAFRGMTLAQLCQTDAEVDALMAKAIRRRCHLAESRAEDIVRRLFGLFRRSQRPHLGGGAGAGICLHGGWARDAPD
jgi:catechol 2,3-dioxygenase-like lactoylglutathione lyase family enzyme